MTPRHRDTGTRPAFENALGFEVDRFQARALDALDADHSVLVAAPTGAGKTVVAEYAVADALARGGKAFYTTPIKALSNQKFRDLSKVHGADRVGLLTGDNSINGEAPVVVMTTEVLRNMIYAGSTTLDGLEVVVLDEVHYLQDPYRGAVWEEVIIHLDPWVRLVCLSATVSNAEEFGDWLSTVRGNTEVVIEERRPVELEQRYVVELRDAEELMVFPTFVDEGGRRVPNPVPSDYDPFGPGRRTGRPRPKRRGAKPVPPDRVEVVRELAGREMLPAIWFIFSRAGCDEALRQCRAAGLRLAESDDVGTIRATVDRHLRGLSDADLDALGVPAWLDGLEAGLASHHAGLVPPMKEAVEELFAAGLVKVVFATETLALGINMPARSVVIERLTKFTGERHENLTPGQFTQLTGRAGRRGIDEVGYGVVLWNRWTTFDQVAALASKRTYELGSSFRPTYNMAVNLVRRHSRAEAHRLLNLSFAQYRVDRRVVRLERKAADAADRLAEARDRARCERGDVGGYVGLVEDRDRLRRAGPGAEVEEALARLRPGDVVHAGRKHGTVVVVQRSTARGGSPRVTAFDAGGKSLRLGASSFRRPPEPVGRIDLPEPFRPKNQGFKKEAVRRLRRAEVGEAPRRSSEREERLAELDDRITTHPVASCPDLDRHLDAHRRVRSLERDERRARERAESQTETLSRLFDDVLALLERRGYVDGWKLTDEGDRLSQVYSEADLLVAESLHEELFDDLDPAAVAAIASLFTYEERGPEGSAAPPRWPTAEVARRAHRVEDLWRDLAVHEERAGLPVTREPEGGFAEMAYRWTRGDDLEDVLGEEVSGGDFVRNVKQLNDLLRQLSEVAPLASTRAAARQAADQLFRGVVEASSRVNA